MKTRIKNPFLLCALMVGLGSMVENQVTAQVFATLHAFQGIEGNRPVAGLTLSSNTLYGTTTFGGRAGAGTIFKINTDGTGFTTLCSFTNGYGGYAAQAGVILSGKTLYGTRDTGGSAGAGAVFKVNTDGTGFTDVYSFTMTVLNQNTMMATNSDGANPQAGLILSGSTLYGTTSGGGVSGDGTIFKVNTDGTDFTNLHTFMFPDGANPLGGLILSGNNLYGTASTGGSFGRGTVFKINTDGTGFTNLYSFTGTNGEEYPQAALILSGNTLYGTAYGESAGFGMVFKVNTDGKGFTNLCVLANPSGLILSDNTLYGTALGGILGTVFKVNIDGTGFTNLYSFTGSGDGAFPQAGLILSGDTLYGTTSQGETPSSHLGTVFSLSFAPQLTITSSAASTVLTWPTNVAGFDYSGFTLQSTTNLVSAVWSDVSPGPVIVNGQNTVTNLISSTQKFYRLSQ